MDLIQLIIFVDGSIETVPFYGSLSDCFAFILMLAEEAEADLYLETAPALFCRP